MPWSNRTCVTFARRYQKRTGDDSRQSKPDNWGMAASGIWLTFWGDRARRLLVGSTNWANCRTIRLLVASGDRAPVAKKDNAGLRYRAKSPFAADDPDGWRPGRFHHGFHGSVSSDPFGGTGCNGNPRERRNDSGLDGRRRIETA